MLEQGSKAPAFSLLGQDGKKYSLSNNKGKWVILYFYPKDDTPGCTVEACSIKDNWHQFEKLDVVVFGASADSVASHKKFKEKYDLPFTLLSDPDKKTLKDYQVWIEKSMFGKKYMGIQRATYIIDSKGIIAKVYPKVTPTSHVGAL
jgi:peroxiredoxin Q/BCP